MKSGGFTARLVAILAPIAALAMLCVLIILPLANVYEDASARIDAAQIAIARYEDAKARLPVLRARLDTTKRDLPRDLLLARASAAEAQAGLQATLQNLIAGSGVTPMSSRSLPPIDRGAFVAFGAELHLRATPPSLAKLIGQIESAKPLLRIETLTISAPEGGQGPVDDAGQPELSAEMTVAGLAAAR
jgi:hypothetical protein